MTDAEVLALHRRLVEIRSVSGEEAAIADFVEVLLRDRSDEAGTVHRWGNSILATRGPALGGAKLVLLNSHLDTVPPAPGWTGDPWNVDVVEGKVIGLGANDAKASSAAMIAAFLNADADSLPFTLGMALVEGEETRGIGAERVVRELEALGIAPAAVIVGEPTSLDIAVAQKGLLVLRLVARGDAAHAAHARRLGAKNAVRALARDLVALEDVELGPEHPELGPATLEPTVLQGGTARNVVPSEASVVLDVRRVPGPSTAELVERIRSKVSGEIEVLSERLQPCATDPAHPLVRAAARARPEARLFGSATLSDWVFFRDFPAIKVGPGVTDRSHQVDEFVLESEILDGAAFYSALLVELGRG